MYSLGAIYRYSPRRGVFQLMRPATLSKRVQCYAGVSIKGKKGRPLSLRASDVNGIISLASAQIDESLLLTQIGLDSTVLHPKDGK